MSNRPSSKVCPTCDNEFSVRQAGGREQVYCSRSCKTKAANAAMRGNHQYKANAQFKHRYGITLEERNEMLKQQGHRCAICNRHEDEVGTLKVDHDHTTGEVRQMLCHGCNVALGHFQDNPETLMAAAAYLMQYENVLLGGINHG